MSWLMTLQQHYENCQKILEPDSIFFVFSYFHTEPASALNGFDLQDLSNIPFDRQRDETCKYTYIWKLLLHSD